MATTARGRRLTTEQRAQQLAVRARTLQGLLKLWPAVDPTDLSGTIDVFTEAAVILAMNGHDESAEQAARYLSAFRIAEGAPGRDPGVLIAAPPARATVAGTIRGAALSGIITARRAGMNLTRSKSNGLVAVAGAVAKLVLTGGWMTLVGTVKQDPVALGWQRVTGSDPCAFCRMLASRGAVYKTQAAAETVPHDDCSCTAEPYYPGDRPLPQNLTYEAEFATAQAWARESGTMSRKTANNQLNNYRRWLANGSPEPGQTTDGDPGND